MCRRAGVQVGLTKVFFRKGAYERLAAQRSAREAIVRHADRHVDRHADRHVGMRMARAMAMGAP